MWNISARNPALSADTVADAASPTDARACVRYANIRHSSGRVNERKLIRRLNVKSPGWACSGRSWRCLDVTVGPACWWSQSVQLADDGRDQPGTRSAEPRPGLSLPVDQVPRGQVGQVKNRCELGIPGGNPEGAEQLRCALQAGGRRGPRIAPAHPHLGLQPVVQGVETERHTAGEPLPVP